MEATWRIWEVHRRLDEGLSEANQQQAGLGGRGESAQLRTRRGQSAQFTGLGEANQRSSALGEANQRSSGLRESAQTRSTVWPVGDQLCIGLKAGLLRDQSKVQARSSRTKFLTRAVAGQA